MSNKISQFWIVYEWVERQSLYDFQFQQMVTQFTDDVQIEGLAHT